MEAVETAKFIQITESSGKLHALDANGNVWIYYPATPDHFAFWGRITSKRADPKKKGYSLSQKQEM